jgi:hypothetical protein
MKRAIEFAEHAPWQGHLPDDAGLATLQCDDIRNAAVDVDRGWGECQDFRNPASAQIQYEAKELYFQRRTTCRLNEAPTLGGIEVLTAAG